MHLDQSQPQITQNFLHFLKTRAAKARVLYILGDLFEIWLGDDAIGKWELEILEAIRQASTTTDIYFMAGNRDFLFGPEAARLAGCQIIEEPFHLTLDNQRITLCHGDLLCSDDVDYQNFRKLVRNPAWQQDFLGKSVEERQQIAQALRDKSKDAMKEKSSEIMDVNQATVEQYMQEHSSDILIHGHTHRPAIHQDQNRQVLGDWRPEASFIRWSPKSSFSLVDARVKTELSQPQSR